MFALLTQVCDIIQQVQSVDSNGRATYTNTIIHTDVKCKLDTVRIRSGERVDSGAAQSTSRALLYMEPITGLTADMHIILNGDTFHIISISDVTNMFKIHHHEIEIVKVGNV